MDWDVFISHAWEDKEDVARPLAQALRRKGLRVWYDEFTLTLGDSLRRSIDRGLAQSRYGVVILSPHFFAKKWTQYELDGLVTREVSSGKTILPVWHNVTREDVRCFSPTLADKLAVSTTKGLDAVLEEIMRALHEEHRPRPRLMVTPTPARPRWPVNWERVGAIAGIIGLLIALSAWLVPNAADWLFKTPTVALTSSPTHMPAPAAGRATIPAATVPPTAAPVPPTAHPTYTPYPTYTPMPTEPTPLPPTDTLTPVPPTDTPTPSAPPPGMVYIPAGEFIMGSNEGDSDEQPVHTVYLDAFYIDKTEVTNAQFAAFVSATGYETDAEQKGCGWIYDGASGECIQGVDWQHPFGPDTDLGGKDEHPVVQVSWNDAKAYCEWAGARLPTEAEWEKAARGTDGLIYPWGNTFDGTKLNFADKNTSLDWSDSNWDDGYAGTASVGSYPGGASLYGALDMAGNVWEWVQDWYGDYPSGRQVNPTGPSSGAWRVIRGGSWFDNGANVRAARRFMVTPDGPRINVGFRCAR